jgi:glycosyltransferase involved in cell wall biosynthesis
VTVINGTLYDLEMKSLIWITDCFVSLHRSEGFGRGLSEAMALGKPVIATAYSGNMDFCSEETAFLVPYSLIGVRPGEYPHWRMQHWADPDVEIATKIMRELIDDPKKGRDKGERARLRLMTDFSYLAIGLRYQRRIDELMQMETRKPEPLPQSIARPRRKKNSARRNAVEH